MTDEFTSSQSQPTPLVGRATELDVIEQMLVGDHARLLSLTGPAGVGKTRLAMEVGRRLAARFADGVTFVDLAPVREIDLVLPVIARAVGMIDAGPRPVLERLQEYLREGNRLLILDTFEPILPAGRLLAELLSIAPQLRILVTTRVPLRLRWEQTLRITPLAVPDLSVPFESLLQWPAVALFVERAQAQRPDYTPTEDQAPLLIQLAQQLDGLPLAIELAAANMHALPLAAIVRRLAQRLESLQWDAQDLPDRQRSQSAAIGWSYELLPSGEQRTFRHLGVFVRRVSLDAIAAVLERGEEESLSTMTALAEKSLVVPGRPEAEPEPSFTVLETVRQYAHEQSDQKGELESAGRAHATFFEDLARRADPELRRRDQVVWYQRVEAEHDNLRAALRWLLEHREHELALGLAGSLGYFWWRRGYHAEGWRWLEEALRGTAGQSSPLAMRGYRVAGIFCLYRGALDQSKRLLEESLSRARGLQDRAGIVESLSYLGVHSSYAGDAQAGRRIVEEALDLAEELHDDFHAALNLSTLAYLSFRDGELQDAASLFTESFARYQAVGDLVSATTAQFTLARTLHQLGETVRAVQLVRDGLQQCLVLENRWQLCLGVEATLLFATDDTDEEARARLLGARDALVQAAGTDPGILDRLRGDHVAVLPAQLHGDGEPSAGYRAGRSLSFEAVVNLAQSVLEDTSRTPMSPETPAKPQAAQISLSEREYEVLRLVAEGLTSKQIGQQLFLSPRTVDHHLYGVFNKLGVNSRAQAVAVATRDGLL